MGGTDSAAAAEINVCKFCVWCHPPRRSRLLHTIAVVWGRIDHQNRYSIIEFGPDGRVLKELIDSLDRQAEIVFYGG